MMKIIGYGIDLSMISSIPEISSFVLSCISKIWISFISPCGRLSVSKDSLLSQRIFSILSVKSFFVFVLVNLSNAFFGIMRLTKVEDGREKIVIIELLGRKPI